MAPAASSCCFAHCRPARPGHARLCMTPERTPGINNSALAHERLFQDTGMCGVRHCCAFVTCARMYATAMLMLSFGHQVVLSTFSGHCVLHARNPGARDYKQLAHARREDCRLPAASAQLHSSSLSLSAPSSWLPLLPAAARSSSRSNCSSSLAAPYSGLANVGARHNNYPVRQKSAISSRFAHLPLSIR